MIVRIRHQKKVLYQLNEEYDTKKNKILQFIFNWVHHFYEPLKHGTKPP